MNIRSFFLYLTLLFAPLVSYGFYAEKPQELEELPHYGDRINSVSKVGASHPEFELGSELNGINQIGFFCLGGPPSFNGDKKRQIDFFRWMKERLEKEGHVIVLDLVNGIDFTGIAKGCSAHLSSVAICMKNFKAQTQSYIRGLERLQLEASTSIRVQETNKICSLSSVWRQEMFVDASDKDNLEMGYKDLVENLIDDLKASNTGYKQKLVFYLYIDTEQEPHLKKPFGKYVSPALTTVSDN